MTRLPAASHGGERFGTTLPRIPIKHSRAPTVLVLSAQRGFCERVAAALRREGLQAWAEEALHEHEAVLAVWARCPDAVIVGRPLAPAAPALCKALAAHAPSSTIIVLSDVLDRASVAAAQRAGARGYLRDDVEAPVLAEVIRRLVGDGADAGKASVRPQASTALAAP